MEIKQFLRKCYFIAVIIPSIIAIIATSIFTVIDDANSTSEWLGGFYWIWFVIIYSVSYCAIVCIFALTIYLNLWNIVRQNLFLKICSWFLFPLGFIVIVITHEILFSIKPNDFYAFIPVVLLNIPFLLGLIFSFVKFNKKSFAQIP